MTKRLISILMAIFMNMFGGNVDVNNELYTLQSPNIAEETVRLLNLNQTCYSQGRFHEEVLYGRALPLKIDMLDMNDDESAEFMLDLKPDEYIGFLQKAKMVPADITEAPDGRAVIVKREKICASCTEERPRRNEAEDTITLFDFLNNLSDEQQKAAFAHLKLKWDRAQGSGIYGRA